MYQGFFDNELHIGHVTNGVHYPTWASYKWRALYEENFGPGFLQDQSNPKYWQKIHDVQDEKIWQIRQELRGNLIDFISQRLLESMGSRQENPQNIIHTVEALDKNALTMGLQGVLPHNKRAHTLFSDLNRLM
jgi:glucan phosphorylase